MSNSRCRGQKLSIFSSKKGFKVTATDSSIVAHQKAKSLAVGENVQVNYKLEDLFNMNWTEKAMTML